LIATTTTRHGLTVRAMLDEHSYDNSSDKNQAAIAP
jgi:hypothetical protein